jgi:sugar fermentation stimulation protein A
MTLVNGARFFTNDREAVLVDRPNRFVIIAQDPATGEKLTCHCPNPGKLLEFIFPGTPLILEKRRGASASKTLWTAAAVRCREGAIAPLYASRTNEVASSLVLGEIIPGLESVRPEYTAGGSRFDFLCVDKQQNRHLVEVKACSLVEYGTAMFPDAPSLRALKHVRELAALSAQGYVAHALFVISHGNPSRFMANLHTDPAFAAELTRVSGAVNIHAALVRCGEDGRAFLVNPAIPVDLSYGRLAAENRGSYIMLLELAENHAVEVGALGKIDFQKGWYVYAGSAQKNLSQRIARHVRKVRKQQHWHLDYLTPFAAGKIKGFPVMSESNLECALAGLCAETGGTPVSRFGASDCSCAGHLYWFASNPMKTRPFVEGLLRYRHGV